MKNRCERERRHAGERSGPPLRARSAFSTLRFRGWVLGTVENQQALNAAHGAGIQAAETVCRRGAGSLIHGTRRTKAFQVLSVGDVKIYRGDGQSALKALAAYSGRAYWQRSRTPMARMTGLDARRENSKGDRNAVQRCYGPLGAGPGSGRGRGACTAGGVASARASALAVEIGLASGSWGVNAGSAGRVVSEPASRRLSWQRSSARYPTSRRKGRQRIDQRADARQISRTQPITTNID